MRRGRSRRTTAILLTAAALLAATTGVALAAFRDPTSLAVRATAATEFPPVVQLVPHFTRASFGGATLTVVPGTWTRTTSSTTRTYSWYRCTVAAGCATTPVGSGTTYTVPKADDAPLGTPSSVYFTVRETVRNVTRSASALSVPGGRQTRGGLIGAYLGAIDLELLTITSTPTTMPAISGSTARVGSELQVGTGTWDDNSSSALGAIVSALLHALSLDGDPTYAYQWLRCGPTGNTDSATLGAAGCTTIGGATSSAYTPTGADAGHRLRVRVTRTTARPVLSGVLGVTVSVNQRAVAVVLTQASEAVAP